MLPRIRPRQSSLATRRLQRARKLSRRQRQCSPSQTGPCPSKPDASSSGPDATAPEATQGARSTIELSDIVNDVLGAPGAGARRVRHRLRTRLQRRYVTMTRTPDTIAPDGAPGIIPIYDVNRVKLGSNSVTLPGIAERLLIDDGVAIGHPDFISKTIAKLGLGAVGIADAQGVGFTCASDVCQSRPAGQWALPVNVAGTILPVRQGAPVGVVDWFVRTADATTFHAEVSDQQLADYTLHGHLLDTRKVDNALAGVANINNAATRAEVARCAKMNLRKYDLSYLYAKLMYYGMIADVHAALAQPINMQMNGLPNVDLHWTNIEAVDFGVEAMRELCTSNRISLIDGIDFTDDDRHFLTWIATAQQPFAQGNMLRTADGMHVRFEAIDLQVVSKRAAPIGNVQNVPITGQTAYAFCLKLATARNEMDDFHKGMMAAMELTGTRLMDTGAPNGARRYRVLRPDYSPRELLLPKPVGFNPMLRLLGMLPTHVQSPDKKLEIDAWLSANLRQRVGTIVLYNAILSAGVSTVLNEMSIQTQDVIAYLTGNIPHPNLRTLLSSSANWSSAHGGGLIPRYARRIFVQAFGMSAGLSVWHPDHWIGQEGSVPDAGQIYAMAFDNSQTLRYFSLLCLLAFIIVIPIAWGISQQGVKVNFKDEVVLNALPQNNGYSSMAGSTAWDTTKSSNQPWRLVPYGVASINAITQHFQVVGIGLNMDTAQTAPQGTTYWNHNVILDGANFAFNADLHVIEPASFTTYLFNDATIRAPRITQDVLGGAAAVIQLSVLTEVASAGFLVAPLPPSVTAVGNVDLDFTNL